MAGGCATTISVRPVPTRASAAVTRASVVDVGGGLLEDEHGWIGERGPGERDELAFARREVSAAIVQHGDHPVGEPGEPAV